MGGSNYDSLIVRGRVSGPSSLLDPEVIAPCGNGVPCQLRPEVRRHGRGSCELVAIDCLKCSLARPVLAQS